MDHYVTESTLMFQGAVNASDIGIWPSGNSLTLESGFGAADAVQNMLLQSHGGVIRLFPPAPPAWHVASFHRLRAEGAFLVSARRAEGKTVFVHVSSEKGGTARLRAGFDAGEIHVAGPQAAVPFRLVDGDVVVECRPGQEFWAWSGREPTLTVEALSSRPLEEHFFGVTRISRW